MNFKNYLNSNYEIMEDGIKIIAPSKSDFFVAPETEKVINNAPFIYTEVEGDFIFKAKVKHDFISTYDACALMAMDHDQLWAKTCFEVSDFHTNTIVSVMTNKGSDDANGIEIENNEIWLQLVRKNNMFATYFSYDDITYKMSRLTYLPMKNNIKVGLVAQSPIGEGGTFYFNKISLEYKTVENIRLGITIHP